MAETKISEGCQFPIGVDEKCGRPTEPARGDEQGRGRPSAYCDNPAHNAGGAWRARQKLKAEGGGGGAEPAADAVERPVTMARETASYLLEQARRLATEQHSTFARLTEQLDTLADPDAASAQLESTSADYEQRLAEAHASWTRSENERREVTVQRDEANTAAEEATANVQELTTQLAEAREENTQHRERAEAAEADRDRLAGQADELSSELTEQRSRVSELQQQTATLTEQAQHLTAERDQYQAEAGQQRTRAEAAEAERDRLAGQAETLTADLAEARDRAATWQEAEATARAELSGVRAELTAAQRATDAAERNMAEWREHYEAQLAEARGHPPAEGRPATRRGRKGDSQA